MGFNSAYKWLTSNLFRHCTPLQLKNYMMLNNSDPVTLIVNITFYLLYVQETKFNDTGSGVFVEKTTVFNRQLLSANKYLMCCEETAVGLRLLEDGVNEHQNV
jgi:hypothetical protein